MIADIYRLLSSPDWTAPDWWIQIIGYGSIVGLVVTVVIFILDTARQGGFLLFLRFLFGRETKDAQE